MVQEMFFAGSESTSSTIEWAMAELLRAPNLMKKVKEELGEVIGQCRDVEEADIDKLPYLQAVVTSCNPFITSKKYHARHQLHGVSHTPKHTGPCRMGNSWDDPLSFKPERFLGSTVEYKGQHFELIPFGSGQTDVCWLFLGAPNGSPWFGYIATFF
ncbi:hypothetical protein RJ639_046222 [Escallonia herrerae]|uniref:Cytochrome P450 n=1 Tax=Escallonia herrerae TaxID=1293975 RepID=A0AA89AZD1_9ASTE|nr:hypothetical protein RJ639_025406 [Escallonia herrerae]KAK3020533.1 hypothetical protein RJ639_046222 [Escallonia herrerae]